MRPKKLRKKEAKELVPTVPDWRAKEEEARNAEIVDAWLHGKPPFKSTGLPNLITRYDLTSTIDHLYKRIGVLEARVNELQGIKPTHDAGNQDGLLFGMKSEYHIKEWLDGDPKTSEEVAAEAPTNLP